MSILRYKFANGARRIGWYNGNGDTDREAVYYHQLDGRPALQTWISGQFIEEVKGLYNASIQNYRYFYNYIIVIIFGNFISL